MSTKIAIHCLSMPCGLLCWPALPRMSGHNPPPIHRPILPRDLTTPPHQSPKKRTFPL